MHQSWCALLISCFVAFFVSLGLCVQVELPLWLAASLSRRNFVEAKMPSRYASNMRNALNADPSPNTVRLRSRSPHYFELGLMLASIVKPTDYELPQLLRKSLAIR